MGGHGGWPRAVGSHGLPPLTRPVATPGKAPELLVVWTPGPGPAGLGAPWRVSRASIRPPGSPRSTRNPWCVSAGATSSSPRWLMSGPRIFKQLPHAWTIRTALPLCPLRGGQVVHPESSGSCPHLKAHTFNSVCEVPLPHDRARGRGHGAVCQPPALTQGQLGRHQQAGTRTLARSSALQPGTDRLTTRAACSQDSLDDSVSPEGIMPCL